MSADRPDVIVLLTDQERAAPPYEDEALRAWRAEHLTDERWFAEHAVRFDRHHTGSLACVPSRPTLLTGQYPDTHGVTQTDGLGKSPDDARMRWLRPGEVPTLGNWFRAAGYDTHYDGKWHVSHADLHDDDGQVLATNTARGKVLPANVEAYLDADPLAEFGFSGWVGPEPHGAALADSGLRRDPLIAARVVAWLEDRYARRAAGDPEARRPFLLVASFVNPHDICLYVSLRLQRTLPPTEAEPPPIPPPPTAGESLADKPALQREYRDRFFSGFGLGPVVSRLYRFDAAWYRRLYHRLHLEVDEPLRQVREAVLAGADDAVIVRTSDHGELLGAHGGLHQKWYQLYDEATRVPFAIARVGRRTTEPRAITTPTSHVDLVPTLLAAAGIDEARTATMLARHFTEVHPLPGRELMSVVDGGDPDPTRAVYLHTRDDVMGGDARTTTAARIVGLSENPPALLRSRVPRHVGTSVEGVVAMVPEAAAAGGGDRPWKLVRTFDDPATWTEPGTSHLTSSGPTGEQHRSAPLDDEWELYDLGADPVEARNRWKDQTAAAVRDHLLLVLDSERARCLPERHQPWPYAARRRPTSQMPGTSLPWPGDLVIAIAGGVSRRLRSWT